MGKKKKNNSNNEVPIEVHCHVMNDNTHKLMETTLLNIEELETRMINCQESGEIVSDDMFMIHDLLVSDISVLLQYRLHSDN